MIFNSWYYFIDFESIDSLVHLADKIVSFKHYMGSDNIIWGLESRLYSQPMSVFNIDSDLIPQTQFVKLNTN